MWTFASSCVEFREPNFVLAFLRRMDRQVVLEPRKSPHRCWSLHNLDPGILRISSSCRGSRRSIDRSSTIRVRFASLAKVHRISAVAVFPHGVVVCQAGWWLRQERESVAKTFVHRKSPHPPGNQPLFNRCPDEVAAIARLKGRPSSPSHGHRAVVTLTCLMHQKPHVSRLRSRRLYNLVAW